MSTMVENTVMTNAEVARLAREYARENGLPVGTRGRISAELFVEYLLTAPKIARNVAPSMGVEVPARGRISKATIVELGTALASNRA